LLHAGRRTFSTARNDEPTLLRNCTSSVQVAGSPPGMVPDPEHRASNAFGVKVHVESRRTLSTRDTDVALLLISIVAVKLAGRNRSGHCAKSFLKVAGPYVPLNVAGSLVGGEGVGADSGGAGVGAGVGAVGLLLPPLGVLPPHADVTRRMARRMKTGWRLGGCTVVIFAVLSEWPLGSGTS